MGSSRSLIRRMASSTSTNQRDEESNIPTYATLPNILRDLELPPSTLILSGGIKVGGTREKSDWMKNSHSPPCPFQQLLFINIYPYEI